MSIVGPQGRWNNDGSPEDRLPRWMNGIRQQRVWNTDATTHLFPPVAAKPDPQDGLVALFATEDGYYPSLVLEPTMRKKPAVRRFGSSP